ncbi:hypothetical protein INT45_013552 [Circinella minor]|uniref:Uncharacterized protein n=1 Tax=Circinella minor TaxID=1195481 RepID=A0A8H7VHA1_9FUNG|nr:hypothetical protein INT45_013552 [Circinella minor]
MTITRNNTFSRQHQQSNIDYGYHTPAELGIKQNEKQVQERKRYRRQKRLLPKRFIYRPRVPSGTARIPLDSDVPQAIDALVENDQYQGEKIYTFLQNTANIAIQRMKMNILSSITDSNNTETLLSTPWRLIPKENKKMAIQYLMRRALRHKKRIRLDLCQKNWITEHLLSECWNKNVVSRNMVTDNHQCQKQEEEQQEKSQQYITENNNWNEREDDWDDFVLETKEVMSLLLDVTTLRGAFFVPSD